MRARRLLGALLIGVALTSLPACQPMLFRNDHRIEIAEPANFATVHMPVELTWSAPGFAAPEMGEFAVFVDRDPMPPGETVAYFAASGRMQNLYIVSSTRLRLLKLDPNPGASDVERNHHDVTVVLLDPTGHRIGESAGFAEFTVST